MISRGDRRGRRDAAADEAPGDVVGSLGRRPQAVAQILDAPAALRRDLAQGGR